jgi:hypothetical protein
MCCLSAIEKFEKMSEGEVKRIGFEIAMKAEVGSIPTTRGPKYQLKSFPGDFSGLNLVCYMYVAFQSTAPDTYIGFASPKNMPPQNRCISRNHPINAVRSVPSGALPVGFFAYRAAITEHINRLE